MGITNKLAVTALASACAAAAVATTLPAQAAPVAQTTTHAAAHQAASKHVLVISVDGLHENDLAWFVAKYPHSALAALVHGGTWYTHARTTFPSDSFPGMTAQFTGADPGTSGVYYDDTFSHYLLAPGTTNCKTAGGGTEVAWTEGLDKSQDPITLDAGQGLKDPALAALKTNTVEQTLAAQKQLTAAILKLTPNAKSLIDTKQLPVDPKTCKPVYPDQYLKTNTVFNVAHAAGLRTAWSDKHPAYEILNGHSGTGVQDFFTPEINSVADKAGDDWSKDNRLTREYDAFKVAAVVNQINGYDHSGTHKVGTPAIFGMNFQTVSTAQKLPSTAGLAGGYTATGKPGPLLQQALVSVNNQVGRMMHAVASAGRSKDTTIILSAKHGNSPEDPKALRRVDDGAILDGLNAAWVAKHPASKDLVSFSVNDDVMMLWLSDRSAAAYSFVAHYLMTHRSPAGTITDKKGVHSTSVASSGLTAVLTGAAAKAAVGAKASDPNAPDVIGLVQHGVVYTGGVGKISEHGGHTADDRNVPIVVWGAGAARRTVVGSPVATTQIAPSILRLLGLTVNSLDAVRSEHTRVLPTLR